MILVCLFQENILTKKPKKKLRYFNKLLVDELQYLEHTKQYIKGSTGDPKFDENGVMYQDGEVLDIPYVQLASVKRIINYKEILSKVGKELSKRKSTK
jgi:hypothetical protein